MKENLKPCAYNQSEGYAGVPSGMPERLTACLLKNEPVSYGVQRA